jgi:hypothetical protein
MLDGWRGLCSAFRYFQFQALADFCGNRYSQLISAKSSYRPYSPKQPVPTTSRDRSELTISISSALSKRQPGQKAHIQRVPYSLFWALLKINAQFDKNPAFTVGQLEGTYNT